MVWGLGLGFRVLCLGLGVLGSRSRVQESARWHMQAFPKQYFAERRLEVIS